VYPNGEIGIVSSGQLTINNTGGNVALGTNTAASKFTVGNGDIEVADIASGIIISSPDGTRYRVTVANGGTLTVAAV
jgi:predicted RecB family endonuclease